MGLILYAIFKQCLPDNMSSANDFKVKVSISDRTFELGGWTVIFLVSSFSEEMSLILFTFRL